MQWAGLENGNNLSSFNSLLSLSHFATDSSVAAIASAVTDNWHKNDIRLRCLRVYFKGRILSSCSKVKIRTVLNWEQQAILSIMRSKALGPVVLI